MDDVNVMTILLMVMFGEDCQYGLFRKVDTEDGNGIRITIRTRGRPQTH